MVFCIFFQLTYSSNQNYSFRSFFLLCFCGGAAGRLLRPSKHDDKGGFHVFIGLFFLCLVSFPSCWCRKGTRHLICGMIFVALAFSLYFFFYLCVEFSSSFFFPCLSYHPAVLRGHHCVLFVHGVCFVSFLSYLSFLFIIIFVTLRLLRSSSVYRDFLWSVYVLSLFLSPRGYTFFFFLMIPSNTTRYWEVITVFSFSVFRFLFLRFLFFLGGTKAFKIVFRFSWF